MRLHIVVTLFLGLLLVAPAAVMGSPMMGGKAKSDPTDPYNKKAADFAVEALNTGGTALRNELGSAKGPLTLVAIKQVSTQVVAGTAYHLVLAVTDEVGKSYDVAAVVWSRPWLEGRNDVDEPAWQLTHAKAVEVNSE